MLRVLLTHGAYRERDLQDTSQTLCYAILRGGRVEGVKMLVAHGANVNAEFVLNEEETPLTFTPLIIAAITGQLAIVELLCESGADVEGRTNVGECALMFAAEKGYFGMVKYLVEEQNANVSCTSAFPFTPIEIAKRQDHANVVQCLLEHGADSPQREMISLETFLKLPELADEEKTKLRAEYADSVAYWERQGLYDDFFDQYFW